MDHYDVLIAGAGLSGIDAAAHIARRFPDRNYAVLEQQGELGGTWALFKYPGLRSDSDMFTLGFGWKPWDGKWAIAEGADILAYLQEAARETGVDQRIKYHHKVVNVDWSTEDELWTVSVVHPETGEKSQLTCKFFIAGTGYYRYDKGYTPDFAGIEDYQGQVVHPQHWPEDLDYSGKRIVVIGSGATAVTLIPSMAPDAGHITMLQRTPTYIMSQPRIHPGAKLTRTVVPRALANKFLREAYGAGTVGMYLAMRRYPKLARKALKRWAQVHLPADFDYDTHLNPPYNPWEQRLCVVPSADLFKALKSHMVDIVTDHIDRFTEKGILLKSGQELEADLVITATGLDVVALGGATITRDGVLQEFGEHVAYKALMANDAPNIAFLLGYSNASWTLKIDLVCDWLMRLFDYMDEHGYTVVTPRVKKPVERVPMMDLASGYVQRAEGRIPAAGTRDPWRLRNNWYFDRRMIRWQKIADDELEFS